LKQHLGASGPDTADVEALKLEVTELRQKCEQLSEQNNELKAKVSMELWQYFDTNLTF
jgi:predicted  nucleic acid-binding Zn-ribbon protein